MITYRVRINAEKWPTEYTVQASNWATAIARAIKEWKHKDGKGSRTKEVSVKAWKAGELLNAD